MSTCPRCVSLNGCFCWGVKRMNIQAHQSFFLLARRKNYSLSSLCLTLEFRVQLMSHWEVVKTSFLIFRNGLSFFTILSFLLKNILGGFNKEPRISIAPISSVPRSSAWSPQQLPPLEMNILAKKKLLRHVGFTQDLMELKRKRNHLKLPVRQSPGLFPRFSPTKLPTGALVPSLQQRLMPNLIRKAPIVIPRQRCDFSLPLGLILLAISTLSCREADAFHQVQPGWTWRSSSAPVETQKLCSRLFSSANKSFTAKIFAKYTELLPLPFGSEAFPALAFPWFSPWQTFYLLCVL